MNIFLKLRNGQRMAKPIKIEHNVCVPQMRISSLVSAGSTADSFIFTLIITSRTSLASGNKATSSALKVCRVII